MYIPRINNMKITLYKDPNGTWYWLELSVVQSIVNQPPLNSFSSGIAKTTLLLFSQIPAIQKAVVEFENWCNRCVWHALEDALILRLMDAWLRIKIYGFSRLKAIEMQSVSYDRKTLLLNSLSFVIFQALKLDLDYKGEKIIALSKELEELQIGGGASEEELNSVKRQKTDLEMRLKEQVSFDSINNFIHTTTSGVLKVGY